jgi:hypothetical protein
MVTVLLSQDAYQEDALQARMVVFSLPCGRRAAKKARHVPYESAGNKNIYRNHRGDLGVLKSMEIILGVFYVALLTAIIFFGFLQEYVYTKKEEWDRRKNSPERKVDEIPLPAGDEKAGSMLALGFTILALAFLIWKILTATFTHL